jgi:uroporphyrinogen decarboxylase
MCYAVEGQGSKSFDKAKGFCFQYPEAAHVLLQKITDTTILYLKEKVKAGVNAVQILILGAECYHLLTIKNFHGNTSTKLLRHWQMTLSNCFRKRMLVRSWRNGKSRASALGVDWTCSPRNARYLSGGNITLQNFDPSRLLSPIPVIKKMVHEMIDEFGKDKYIVNLGHGILPNIPVDHAKRLLMQ